MCLVDVAFVILLMLVAFLMWWIWRLEQAMEEQWWDGYVTGHTDAELGLDASKRLPPHLKKRGDPDAA